MKTPSTLDADAWIDSWDLQQNAHIRNRVSRFQFMFDLVEHICGESPTILDLACGPGSLSGRFLKRFPKGRSIAVDYDPVLLKIAGEAMRYDHARVTFVEANLASSDWIEKLPVKKFDAIMSTTALHWLNENALENLYTTIYSLLNPGGIFLNGDHIYPEAEPENLKSVFRDIRHSYEEQKFAKAEALNWSDWWKKLSSVEGLDMLFEERKLRYPEADRHDHHLSLETHLHYLESAGFENVGVGWQDLDNRVLTAIK